MILRWLIFLLIGLGACVQSSNEMPIESATEEQTPWEQIGVGLEQDLIRQDAVFFQTVRIDPAQYIFRVHYRPNAPLTIEEWRTVLPTAQVIINTNFFTDQHIALGLLISDGVRYGQSYVNRGGTFFVDDAIVGIRSNVQQPYRGENYSQAVQAFPMLVLDGQPAYTNTSEVAISRRTVIAQDTDGHLLMMTTAGFGLSLPQLSEFLASSDLNIQTALNLDGGGSTMMYVAPSDITVVSLDPVPAVLAVYSR